MLQVKDLMQLAKVYNNLSDIYVYMAMVKEIFRYNYNDLIIVRKLTETEIGASSAGVLAFLLLIFCCICCCYCLNKLVI